MHSVDFSVISIFTHWSCVVPSWMHSDKCLICLCVISFRCLSIYLFAFNSNCVLANAIFLMNHFWIADSLSEMFPWGWDKKTLSEVMKREAFLAVWCVDESRCFRLTVNRQQRLSAYHLELCSRGDKYTERFRSEEGDNSLAPVAHMCF